LQQWLHGHSAVFHLARRMLFAFLHREDKTMKKIREWAFPAGLLLAWFIVSVYTVFVLVDAHSEHQRLLNPAAATAPQT
jgi:hypothetical protein